MSGTKERERDDDEREHDTDLDPGAYVGRLPERQAETIPGGITDADERIAAHSTQSGPAGGDQQPDGHREGAPATDDTVSEAGEDR
jgi:hypothetical protein